jgi:hypothetical protein
MQASEQLSELERENAVKDWLGARDSAVEWAKSMVRRNVHKQVVNRILEPWMWITVIISGTEWNNFWALRDHAMAEPHFQQLARLMRSAMRGSQPLHLFAEEWHMPLILGDDIGEVWTAVKDRRLNPEIINPLLGMYTREVFASKTDQWLANDVLCRVSVARCARVSYLTHDGKRDLIKDLELHSMLMVQEPLHASPAEHVAMALDAPEPSGNFRGFKQWRKFFSNENVPG